MSDPIPFWKALFPRSDRSAHASFLPVRVIQKNQRPFLLLPRASRPAAVALDLYPAQTPRARIAKGMFRALLRVGLAVGTRSEMLGFSPGDRLVRFILELVGCEGDVPTLAILAGNPSTAGQRFIILIFGANGAPKVVVKVGISSEAQALVRREKQFLADAAPGSFLGIPKLLAHFEDAGRTAIALPWIGGSSPNATDAGKIQGVLESWVNPSALVVLEHVPPWQRLMQFNTAFPARLCSFARRETPSTVYHGDFAPWNIKVDRKECTVIDWERGELSGVPGWDWLHYILQPAILVRRLGQDALLALLLRELRSSFFNQYLRRCGLVDHAAVVIESYLLHMINVIRPSEGLDKTRLLLNSFQAVLGHPRTEVRP